MEENHEYTMKETTEITDLSSDLLRLYEKEFNLQIGRTPGGHRRYGEKDINTLITIKKKIQEQNWSYKQVRAWLNGEDVSILLQEQQVSSNLEKKLEEQQDMIRELTLKVEQSMTLQVEMIKQIQNLQQENNRLEQITERRNQDLIDTLIEEKRKDKEEKNIKKTLFSRLFGK
ncbi:MerR family transcriptional regulator [Bacillus thuringiensis]